MVLRVVWTSYEKRRIQKIRRREWTAKERERNGRRADHKRYEDSSVRDRVQQRNRTRVTDPRKIFTCIYSVMYIPRRNGTRKCKLAARD